MAEVRVSAHAPAVAAVAATSGHDSPVRTSRATRPSSTVTPSAASRSLNTVPPTCATTAQHATTNAATVGSGERGPVRPTAAHRAASTSAAARTAPSTRPAYSAASGWPASASGPTSGASSR